MVEQRTESQLDGVRFRQHRRDARVLRVVVAGALIVVGASCGGDDDDDASSTSPATASEAVSTPSSPTTEEVTTTAVPATTEEVTTTAVPATTEEVTTTLPRSDSIVVEPSALATPLVDFWNGEGAEAPPFEDGEIEAHWYSWDERYLVVYAGYDAAAADPQCVGGQQMVDDGDLVLSTNYRQPTAPGGCDPEDWFTTGFNPAVIVSDDVEVGLRVCGRLVMFHTGVPLVADDGNPQPGQLLGSVGRFSELNDGIVGVGSDTTIDNDLITGLDPTATAYELPDGWLSDGTTTVSC